MPEDVARARTSERRPTLQDVADAVGVSVMTVSRALNGYPNVSMDTRRRVLREAERIGYRPSSLARMLRTNQSRLIGVFSPNMMMPLHSEIVVGAQDAAAERGYQLLLDVNAGEGEARHSFMSDGDLIMGPPQDQARRTPRFDRMRTVSLMGQTTEIDAVDTDLAQATYNAVQHLLAVGYRRIALIEHPHSPAQRGYDRAIGKGELPDVAGLVQTVGNDAVSVGRAIDELIGLPEPPDALIVVSLAATPLALRSLGRRGIAIGRKLGFVGTEGSRGEWGDLLNPGLTAIRVPGYEIGAAGARRLLERLAGDTTAPQRLEFPSELVIRESTPGR